MMHAQNDPQPCNVIIKTMIHNTINGIPADITRPSVFDLSCVRIHVTLDFSENSFEVCSALILFQSLV
jgi:hypothetical protein